MERALSAIYAQARTALQETGVNTLYLALGCLEWYDAAASQKPMYAPLLLHSVEMTREIVGGKYRYKIASMDDDTQVNITLSERLYQNFQRRLPEFGETETPESFFRQVTEAVKDLPRWRVRRFATVGHFAFARLVMYHDLDNVNWPGEVGIIGSPVISDLFARDGMGSEALFAEEYAVDEPAIAAKVPLLITDADSSQFSAIVDVMDGKNLAIKGPPGTGKSQTITNIIAAALAANKTVLFVAEKMAALNVVKDRLEKADLGHFCFELHSTKARKKDILASLESRLELERRTPRSRDLAVAVAEIEKTRNQLWEYVNAINSPFGGLGKTIHDILWAEQRTRNAKQGLPDSIDEVTLADAIAKTKYDLDMLKDRLSVLAATQQNVVAGGRLELNPWRGVHHPDLDYFGRDRLIELMAQFRSVLFQLSTAVRDAGEDLKTAFDERIDEISSLAASLSRLPKPSPSINADICAALVDGATFKAVSDFDNRQGEWLTISSRLSDATDNPGELAAQQEQVERLATIITTTPPGVTWIGDLAAAARKVEVDAIRLTRIIDVAGLIARTLGVETEMTIGAVRKLIEAARHAASLPADLRALRHPQLHDDGAAAVLADGHDRAQQFLTKRQAVDVRLRFDLDRPAGEWRTAARTLRDASWLSKFGTNVRSAKSKHRSLMRESGKVATVDMVADLETVADCVELAVGLANDLRLKAICGVHFRGHETSFDSLIAVNAYALKAKGSFTILGALDSRLRQILLDSPATTIEAAVALVGHPDFEVADALVRESDGYGEGDLTLRRDTLIDKASKIAEAAQLSLALCLKPAAPIAIIGELPNLAAAYRAAVSAVDSNTLARQVLGDLWQGVLTPRTIVTGVLDIALDIEQAQLPEVIRRHLYHPDYNDRIRRLQGLTARLCETLEAALSAWAQTVSCGEIDEIAFLGSQVERCSIEFLSSRIERGGRLRLDRFSLWISGASAGCRCGVPLSGRHAGRA